MSKVMSIPDMDLFCLAFRELIAENLLPENRSIGKDDLDGLISLGQIKNLIEAQSLGKNENNEETITEEIYDQVFECVSRMMYGVGLAKLAAADRIEQAWDSELNEMIFWQKSLDNEQSLD